MTAPFLELDRISAGYHGRPVLNGVSLGVSAGSVTVIIGPNGHGKTTLMRTISGLLPLFAGSIRFEGAALDGLSVERIVERGVVHIPQGDLLFPEMTVLENLQMGAYLPDAGKEAARRLEQVFEVLPRLGERRGQTDSVLALGRGLMTGGRILLIDEPSLGLAPILIDQVYQVLAQLKEEGRTILLVEESASRAASIADRIHLLDNGRIIWEGPPAELEHREELIETYLGG
jgi:branched-chain amino acid transport system ATP-binding protein